MTDYKKMLIFALAPVALLAGCAQQTLPGYAQPGQENLTSQVRRLQGSLATQERSLQELGREVVELQNLVEQQQRAIVVLQGRASTAPVAAAAIPVPAVQPVLGTSPGEAKPLPADLQGSPTDIYLRAFGNYANGRYDTAILGFEAFLQNFPNNSYASNAHFWMADCYLKQQQLLQASTAFGQMLQQYPQAPKAPEALLKIATIALQLDDPDQARAAVERLQRRYPDSAAAKKSEKLALP